MGGERESREQAATQSPELKTKEASAFHRTDQVRQDSSYEHAPTKPGKDPDYTDYVVDARAHGICSNANAPAAPLIDWRVQRAEEATAAQNSGLGSTRNDFACLPTCTTSSARRATAGCSDWCLLTAGHDWSGARAPSGTEEDAGETDRRTTNDKYEQEADGSGTDSECRSFFNKS